MYFKNMKFKEDGEEEEEVEEEEEKDEHLQIDQQKNEIFDNENNNGMNYNR